jgi:hypothetical protein
LEEDELQKFGETQGFRTCWKLIAERIGALCWFVGFAWPAGLGHCLTEMVWVDELPRRDVCL